jgi:riboflavin kinase/FMN adenylyltransferase
MALIVVRSPQEWAARFGAAAPQTVVTIGNFDGVHLGHQKILRGVVERARATGALAAAVTFDPYPLKVLRPEEAPPLILTLEQRLAALEELGLDDALVLHFDLALSRLSPEDFVRRILVDTLRVRAVLVGGNFRFGYRQAGDAKRLAELGREFRFAVEAIPPVVLRRTVVSSTAIRRAVQEGRVSFAGRWLGRPFALGGTIRPGTGQGRRLVVPTLNLDTQQELLPKTGVYVTETRVAARLYRSATNVGFRPTFDGRRLTIESHLFDFSRDLIDGQMEVRFWTRLRDEKKFANTDALREQVLRDLSRAREFFRRLESYSRSSAEGVRSSAGRASGPRDLT